MMLNMKTFQGEKTELIRNRKIIFMFVRSKASVDFGVPAAL